MVMGSVVFSIPFVALFVAYFAFLPSIPAILLAEMLGKRDWLYHAISGAVVALVVVGFIRCCGRKLATATVTDPSLALALIGSGMCGGIAYWLVAGRLAGNWRGRARPANANAARRDSDRARVGYWPASPCSSTLSCSAAIWSSGS